MFINETTEHRKQNRPTERFFKRLYHKLILKTKQKQQSSISMLFKERALPRKPSQGFVIESKTEEKKTQNVFRKFSQQKQQQQQRQPH